MPLTLNALQRAALRMGIVFGFGWLASSCAQRDPLSVFPTITVSVSGTGMGTGRVRANDPVVPIDCVFPREECKGSFLEAGGGGSFSLTATPAPGSRFSSWTGCSSVNGNDCVVSFAAGQGGRTFSVSAQFDVALGGVGVRISRAGSGGGYVHLQRLPADVGPIDCENAVCAVNFVATEDGAILLQAGAVSGSVFAGWTGCPAASGDTCTLSYVASAANGFSVVARFDLASPVSVVSVTVLAAGAGRGRVASTGTVAGITCDFPSGASCAASFPAGGGGSFDLVASPASGSVFSGWSGCPSASGSVCTISYPAGVASTFSVTARFDLTTGAQDSLTLYNGTASTANMVVGSEAPGPGNSLTRSAARNVLIPTALGTVVSVRAYIGSVQVTTACTVTARAWTGGTHPLVALFSEGSAYVLGCYNF